MRGKAQRVARPAQTRLQNSGVTGPKFTIFGYHSNVLWPIAKNNQIDNNNNNKYIYIAQNK